MKWYEQARKNHTFWWSANYALWHTFWFYRNVFPYGYVFGRGFLYRKIKV